jgi:predicted TIM-barrel fold metal-dependent hydrolase
MTAGTQERTPAEVRAGLDHPVIDADGHWIEHIGVLREALGKIGGDAAAVGASAFHNGLIRSHSKTIDERRAEGLPQEGFWGLPTRNTRDRASAMIPQFLYERLDELGHDFSVMYPTMGLTYPSIDDEEMRVATCNAFNIYSAERFAAFVDRMTPAAIIPMHTPEEAIAELDHAVGELGMKVVMLGSLARRRIPRIEELAPELADDFVAFDVLGIDSPYDYDPVWQRCLDLGVSPTFHTPGRAQGFMLRNSPSNFVFNHIGHFASAAEAVCKALFLGGVTRRFPKLQFGLLEGGVGWGIQLLGDLVEHWEVRNPIGLEETRPSSIDARAIAELAHKYGDDDMARAFEAQIDKPMRSDTEMVGNLDSLDDFAACEVTSEAELGELFVDNFFFGCEADDRMNARAFQASHNPFGSRFNAFYGSDIGHFDVADFTEVLPDAHGLVTEGLMSDDDFKDFVFANPVRFWGNANPSFFDGTVIEAEAKQVLAGGG